MQQNKLTREQISVLDFWHKIEFFLPYDLQEKLSEIKKSNQIYSALSVEAISSISSEKLWANPYQGEDEEVTSFELFIGVYAKEELAEQLRKCLALEEDNQNANFIGNADGGKLKGLSCCAKIRLDEFGCLDPYQNGNIQVSTAPWALGQIYAHNGDLGCLDFAQYDNQMQQLKVLIADFLNKRVIPKVTEEKPLPSLEGADVSALVKLVMEWMNFQTNVDKLADFYFYPIKGKRKKEKDKSTPLPFTVDVEQIQVSIINSHFAKDLANVIRAGENGEEVSEVLISYLSNKSQHIDTRLDLYNTEAGKKKIIENLHPQYINHGHWFSDNKHHMSLMQQFAINTIFKEQYNQPLFSVNGPPGTGKTTLLRDIFAHNIVSRASILASDDYAKVEDTFEAETMLAPFRYSEALPLRVLKKELTGYEMVVTSANNAAVQNISEELPQVNALGKNWQTEALEPKVTYLQTVVRNLTACKKKNGQKKYYPLEPKQSPWGLISCVLGNRENRRFFAEQFAVKSPDAENPDSEAEGLEQFPENYFDTIYSWRRKYNGLSFNEAQQQFKVKEEAVKQHIRELTHYMEVEQAYHQLVKQNFEQKLQAATEQIENATSQLEILKEEKVLLEQSKPNSLIKWLVPKKQRIYLEKALQNNAEQKLVNEERLLAKIHYQQAEKGVIEKQSVIELRSQYQSQFGYHQETTKTQVHLPVDEFEALEQDEWQISGFWSDEGLNQKRAELFAAALSLHEAWLAESMSYFSANILAVKNLLNGQQLQGDKAMVEKTAQVIWQSLFMMVPVASTTFASFGSLFHCLGAKSLGWVFVDEAGQAVPQAAVGALWRAKNAVVVGDPLQIEPVFTTPENLTDILLQASKVNVDFEVSPHKTSVQVLADKANAYGANIEFEGEKIWIGSPLRVHRRCLNPMFRIANRIAYQGKMVFGLDKKKDKPTSDPWLMGESAWLHLAKGDRQEESEIQLAVDIFRQLCLQRYKEKELPPIYIISPFKEVREQLRQKIQANAKLWQEFGVKGSEWVRNNVGTVHTFQGKENSMVLLVLGRNDKDIGKAMRLATKPNLLNVAATRAKDRFFIIGDYYVWKDKYECFKQAAPILEKVIDAATFFKELEERVKASQ